MAYAPYTNDRRDPCVDPRIIGCFREADCGHVFEYAERMPGMFPEDFGADCDKVVYVGNGELRLAKVLKTVAYIVTGERPDGSASYERWSIRGHRVYAR